MFWVGLEVKSADFRMWCEGLKDLTPHQKQVLESRLHPPGPASNLREELECRMQEHPGCPHCGGMRIHSWGFSGGVQRYRCGTCGRTFNALSGTPLARLRHREVWSRYAEQLTDGSSVRRAASILGVSPNTAFRWRHRFLALPREERAGCLTGIVEVEETFFPQSYKGQHPGKRRSAVVRKGRNREGNPLRPEVPVLICRDRAGNEADFVLDKADSAQVEALLDSLLAPDGLLCTDDNRLLVDVAQKMNASDRAASLATGCSVVARVCHVRNVMAYENRLRQWMQRFHGVATSYLPNYLGWRRFLESHAREHTSRAFLRAALGRRGVQQLSGTCG